MKISIGRCLMAIALLHTVYAPWKYGGPLLDIAGRGFYNSIAGDPQRAAATWFVLFGAGLFMLGLTVAALEKQHATQALKPIGWALLVLGCVGVVLMPASGFWLVFPPAAVLLLRKARPAKTSDRSGLA
ncbi:DUF6463 family protein [Polaromonas sp.]|uniref:DUF6463 family protein n=1 Tax=Polaromonas sp. TaxID=1869339 RepID=UPI0025D586F8|nr:DUF6463 family protein [Polaromonas sp.]